MSDESGDDSDENTNFLGTYVGERNELGQRHGDGKTVLPSKDTYEGQYVHGLRQGLGTYKVTKKGNVLASYEGEWSEGMRSGFGTFKYSDGSEYKGFWEKDKRHGQGVMLFANGQEYCGLWKSGLRDDTTGILKYPGALYIGGWKDGTMHGPGAVVYEAPAPAVCIISCWENGKPRGPGVVARERFFLKGNFFSNDEWRISSHHPISELEGHIQGPPFESIFDVLRPAAQLVNSKFKLQMESFFSGDGFVASQPGSSMKSIANGFLAAKTWLNKTHRSSSKLTKAREMSVPGQRHGDGKTVLPSKDTYEGQYVHGVRQGLGTYKVTKKDNVLASYEGEWSEGVRRGFGTLIFSDGSKYKKAFEKKTNTTAEESCFLPTANSTVACGSLAFVTTPQAS
ncbi:uncharacterized protein LOC132193674 [Neocloeon triangulifer]|uniref:uncharacterized protein LOC132193674 n=1 Tax=Neocloeon triangulifer TaxID=2078957 RepID=UPI00286ECE3C|nr:uncharacterized protein LOC132193674 [Neocloeon triangulifer]